jgi:hypothetical protein
MFYHQRPNWLFGHYTQPGRGSCPCRMGAVDGPGAHPWPRFSLRKIHKERGFRRRQFNFVNADDLTRRRLYFQSSLSFGRDGLYDQQTITLAFPSFSTKLLLTYSARSSTSRSVWSQMKICKKKNPQISCLWSSFLTRSPVAVSYWALK